MDGSDPTSVNESPTWSIGELAAETGLTLRALRHFEDIGLLPAVDRSSGGQRSYRAADVERVYRIVALRALGIPLGEIAGALGSPPELVAALRAQLEQVERQLADLADLRDLLRRVTDRVESEPITIEELIAVIRRTAVSQGLLDEYLDRNDQERLEQGAAALGADAERIVHVEYPRLYAAANRELRAGTSPDAPAMQAVAAELESFAGQLAGGETSEKVQTMWQERSEEIAGVDYRDLGEYVMAARRHYRRSIGIRSDG